MDIKYYRNQLVQAEQRLAGLEEQLHDLKAQVRKAQVDYDHALSELEFVTSVDSLYE
jgi:multidrug resistance efflux pump